jgi:hypothetical protein
LRHCDGATQIAEPSQEALDGFGFVMPSEVIRAQVFVSDTVAEHEEGSGQHGGGHREDGLLGTPAGFDPQELRLQIAILGANGSPGRRNESSFEPRSAFAHARRAAFARTLVIARA